MRPATAPRPALAERLLVQEPTGAIADRAIGDLPSLLRAGDLLVLNDAATIPASLAGRVASRATSGLTPPAAPAAEARVEVRLTGAWAPDGAGARFGAVLLGDGDWRTPTERRPPPPPIAVGDAIDLGGLAAVVVERSPISPRLVSLRPATTAAAAWTFLLLHGRPVQYSYLDGELEPWATQSRFAGPPWAVEAPSAGRALTHGLLEAARGRGVEIARITEAAGLSSTGDPAIDAALPLPERYEVPAETVIAVGRARSLGGRVIAVGTTVARALESAAAGGTLVPGGGITDLRLGPRHALRVADALLTGFHEPAGSHYALLQAFAPGALLDAAYAHAEAAGYLGHELGDLHLILRG